MTGGWFEERGGLAGSVAVITGGAGGLGKAIATDLAANGVRLAVLDIDAEAAEALRGELASRGAAAIVHIGDARHSDALTSLFEAVADVSGCVVFLASRLSEFVTGTTLHPDGGTFASAGWFNWPGSGWANHVPDFVLEQAGLEESGR